MDIKPGSRFYVLWRPDEAWQVRIVVAGCSSEEYQRDMEAPAPPRSAGLLWYALTPDGDVYPHVLARREVHGFAFQTEDGSIIRSSGPSPPRDHSEIYGGTWSPSLEVFSAVLRDYLEVKPPGPPGKNQAPPSRSGGQTQNDLAMNADSGDGAPPGDPSAPDMKWTVAGGSSPTLSRGDVLDAASKYIVVGEFGLAEVSDGTVMIQLGGVSDEADIDARVLPVVATAEGVRRRNFTDSARELTESEWLGWPLRGPRTAKWCVDFLGQEDRHPRARHTKWRHEAQLMNSDIGVADHELVMRTLELAIVFDQLNVSELCCFELLLRKAQVSEWRHRDRICGQGAGDDIADDEFLFLGTSETRGMLMVCPELSDHITAELHKEATVMKERRKLRDERRIAHNARESDGSQRGLQKKINNQQDEIKQLQNQLKQKGGKGSSGKGAGEGG